MRQSFTLDTPLSCLWCAYFLGPLIFGFLVADADGNFFEATQFRMWTAIYFALLSSFTMGFLPRGANGTLFFTTWFFILICWTVLLLIGPGQAWIRRQLSRRVKSKARRARSNDTNNR